MNSVTNYVPVLTILSENQGHTFLKHTYKLDNF